MAGEVDIERAQREEARWRILRALDAGRPGAVSETILFRCLQDIKLKMSPRELRRHLDYLQDRSLITILDEDTSTWSAELTRVGIDVVEYTVPCEPGIARPPKWD